MLIVSVLTVGFVVLFFSIKDFKSYASGLTKNNMLDLASTYGIILDKEIEDLIAERQEARKAKNFARADEIRDTLAEQGIILEDTREGVKWKRA